MPDNSNPIASLYDMIMSYEQQERKAQADIAWAQEVDIARQREAEAPDGSLGWGDYGAAALGGVLGTVDLPFHAIRASLAGINRGSNRLSGYIDNLQQAGSAGEAWETSSLNAGSMSPIDLWRATHGSLSDLYMKNLQVARPGEESRDQTYGTAMQSPWTRATVATIGGLAGDFTAIPGVPSLFGKGGVSARLARLSKNLGREVDPALRTIRRSTGMGGAQAAIREASAAAGERARQASRVMNRGGELDRAIATGGAQRTPEQLRGLLDRMVQERSGTLNGIEISRAEDASAMQRFVGDAIDRSLAEAHADEIVRGIPGPRPGAPFVPSNSPPAIGETGRLHIEGRLQAGEANYAMRPENLPPAGVNFVPSNTPRTISPALRDKLAQIAAEAEGLGSGAGRLPLDGSNNLTNAELATGFRRPVELPPAEGYNPMGGARNLTPEELAHGMSGNPLNTVPPPAVKQGGALTPEERAFLKNPGKTGEPVVGETGVAPSELPQAPSPIVPPKPPEPPPPPAAAPVVAPKPVEPLQDPSKRTFLGSKGTAPGLPPGATPPPPPVRGGGSAFDTNRHKDINKFMNPNGETGSANVGLVAGGTAGAALGAITGAKADKENPVRGAILGGIAGGVLGVFAGGAAAKAPGELKAVDALGSSIKGTSASRVHSVTKGMDRINAGLQWTKAVGQTGAAKTLEALTMKIPGFTRFDDAFTTMTKRGAPFHDIILRPEAQKELGGEAFDHLARAANKAAKEIEAAGLTGNDLAHITYKREGNSLFDPAMYERIQKASPDLMKAIEETERFAEENHDALFKLGIIDAGQHAQGKGKYLMRTYEEELVKQFNKVTGDMSGGERIAVGSTVPAKRKRSLDEATKHGLEMNPLKRLAATLNRQAYLRGWGEVYSNLTEFGRSGESAFHGTVPDWMTKAEKVWHPDDAVEELLKVNPRFKEQYSFLKPGVYGKASGGWLRNDVMAVITDQHKTYTGWNSWIRNAAQMANRSAAVYRTAVFPRDLVTNGWRSTFTGISIFNPLNWPHYRKALQLLAADSLAHNSAVMKIGKNSNTVAEVRRGMLGEQAITQSFLRKELNDGLGVLQDENQTDALMGHFLDLYHKGPTTGLDKGLQGVKNTAQGSLKFMAKLKVDVDNVFRAAHVIKAMEGGMSMREATLHMMQYWTNPAFTSMATNTARNLGGAGAILGQPGISYSHETVRILKNVITTRPEGLIYGAATMYAVSRAADVAMGVTGAQRDAINKEYGPAAMVLGFDSNGEPLVLDPFRLDTGDNVAGVLNLRGKTEGSILKGLTSALPVGGVLARGLGNAAMAGLGQEQAPLTKMRLRQPWQSPGWAAFEHAGRAVSPAGFGQLMDIQRGATGLVPATDTALKFTGFTPEQAMTRREDNRLKEPGRLKRSYDMDKAIMRHRLADGVLTLEAYEEALEKRRDRFLAEREASFAAQK